MLISVAIDRIEHRFDQTPAGLDKRAPLAAGGVPDALEFRYQRLREVTA
jgi:hypothetical protein